MNIKELEVVDVMGAKTGKKIKVDLDDAQIRSYSNKNNEAIYSTVDLDGEMPVDVIVNKQITDIEERLSTWNNPVKLMYSIDLIDGDEDTNDPDGEIWNKLVKLVKKNQDKYFTKTGDWRKRIQANVKKEMLEVVDD